MGAGIKKGDKVQVITGRDKGKTGKVLKFAAGRVVVEGVNLVKKHLRRRSEGDPGGVKEIPASLNASNVALYCGKCGKGVRFGVKVMKDKTKVRVCARCKQTV